MTPKTVDNYIQELSPAQAEIVTALRRIVRTAAPEAKEAFKWAQPVYESNGPFCYIKAFTKAVNFGFWRGVDLDDPTGQLQGSGEKMRHIKIEAISEIDEDTLAGFVRQAIILNELKGDPTRNK